MLSKHKWGIVSINFLTICSTITTSQLIRAENTITTATSIKNAPYSKVFQTGSIYAVRDHDFRGSEPALGVSTLWSKNPTKDSLLLGVRYCVPDNSLVGSDASLTRIVLLSKNQPLVTINQPIKQTPSYQKVVQSSTTVPELGFWGPGPYWGNDGFWDGVDEPFWAGAATFPSVTCSAGGSRFNIAPFASAIAQLPPQTLQMKLIFSNGATSQWELGKKTVQALKELLAIPETSSNTSQAPLAK
ncbi:hypothetical protein SAMD00079811_75880 (plasmid) [Scytonema sp. HK-05]|uniref:hypothetical protein n=1 Tax=Scytonema sp. HK-05 TaxID=1137095 RepID=UPI000935F74E|nr:hypothetical protein [Scytonema sp. HK-05]OKH43931.1 hypothetical protein NIES2130_38380 [Scytonema sp. HK-05]BAY49959.1 hypothetical protein SAMD00079811_75880 [Scytonema sp. HK-05]